MAGIKRRNEIVINYGLVEAIYNFCEECKRNKKEFLNVPIEMETLTGKRFVIYLKEYKVLMIIK